MNGVAKFASYFAATLLLPTCAVLLRWIGLKRTCRFFGVQLIREGGPSPNWDPNQTSNVGAQIYEIVHRVARRLPIHALCVPRSIIVCRILKWFGKSGVVRISVKRTEDDLEAHAWVESDHVPLGEPDPITKGFQPF